MPRDEDDDFDDRPARRRRDDEDDDRPRRDDEDDDFDDRPRRRRPAKSGGGSKTVLIVVAVVLAVIAVPCIAVMIGLLLPAVQKVREAASRATEQNNMKVVALGMFNDESATGGFHAPFAHDPTGKIMTGNSFRVSLLPYMEQANLYQQFDLTQPWNSPRNKPHSDVVLKDFTTPLDGPPTANTPFRVFVGGGAVFTADGKPVKPMSIQDGTSNTILFAHATQAVPWAEPNELPYSPTAPLPPLGHKTQSRTGFNVAMADGSVRFIKSGVSEPTLRALITKAGGEMVPFDF